MIAGVDPGRQGAVCFMSEDSRVAFPFSDLGGEIDLVELRTLLEEYKPKTIYIEEVHAIFGSSAGATFSFGAGYGSLIGLFVGLQIPFVRIKPKTWQASFFSLGGKLAPKERKQRCLKAAKELFPKENFLATERSKIPHSGIVDATLLAHYALRVYG